MTDRESQVVPDRLVSLDGWDVDFAAAAAVAPCDVATLRGDTTQRGRIASVSKPLVAVAVLIAVEEGTLALEDPCGPPGATVRHLLAHAGGYGFSGDRILAAPGARRIYSNTGFERLGVALADASGLSIADYIAQAVLEPLRMGSTELRGSPAKDIWSTVDDLARFAAELLRPTLLDRATATALRTSQFPTLAGVLPDVGRFDPNPWGLGVEIRGTKQPHWTGRLNSPETFGHFGGSGTFLWIDPIADRALVCLTDREFGPWALTAWPALSDAVLTAAP